MVFSLSYKLSKCTQENSYEAYADPFPIAMPMQLSKLSILRKYSSMKPYKKLCISSTIIKDHG